MVGSSGSGPLDFCDDVDSHGASRRGFFFRMNFVVGSVMVMILSTQFLPPTNFCGSYVARLTGEAVAHGKVPDEHHVGPGVASKGHPGTKDNLAKGKSGGFLKEHTTGLSRTTSLTSLYYRFLSLKFSNLRVLVFNLHPSARRFLFRNRF